jgi:DNA-binding response OmpR family regulator
MQRIALLYQTEAGAVLEPELTAAEFEVVPGRLADIESVVAGRPIDAIIAEAATSLVETKRLLESPLRGGRTPVIALVRAEQVAAIDPAWALDDFLVLPVAGDELVLRLRRAIWRRTGIDSANTLHAGDLVVDLANYKVFVDGVSANLTYKEFELLRFLMTSRGKVLSRETLLNRVWGYEYYGGARTVDVHIRRLRSKIETESMLYIETVRNVGYSFNPQPQTAAGSAPA